MSLHSADGASRSGSKYDRQLIVAFIATPQDEATLRQAAALHGKHRDPVLPSEVVLVSGAVGDHGLLRAEGLESLRLAMAGRLGVPHPVTGRSRIYLVGEGDADARTLAGWTAGAVADLLANAGLRGATMVSIIAEGAGRDPEREHHAQTEPGARSFASLLHRALWEHHRVAATIHARLGAVRVLTEAAATKGALIEAGRKVTTRPCNDQAAEHHVAHSKLRFWWDAGVQRCAWAY
ncbi:MAG: hypothetical protein IH627_01275 [Rubrivivax sp.]|nr:hypothetical protein [Rubrivivax sp.]